MEMLMQVQHVRLDAAILMLLCACSCLRARQQGRQANTG